MKKKILSVIIGIFMIVGLTTISGAATWYVDWDGLGPNNDTATANGHFTITSPNAVVFDDVDDSLFTNYGLVTVLETANDDYTLWGDYTLTGERVGTNELTFDGGSLSLYVNDLEIATFSLSSGSGFYLGDVNEIINGAITLEYSLTTLEDGYLYWGDSTPWSIGEVLVVTKTNMQSNDNTAEIANLINYFSEVDGDDLFLASAGQVEASPIPVPSAFILLGSGIIGLIGFRRKNC